MKKVIIPILLLVMLFPIIVYAATCDANSIKVTSVEVKNKNGNASELEEANINGTSINLKLKMIEVGDNIDYTIKIKNDSDEDYELDNTTLNSNTDYFEYSLKSDDNSNIVPANSSKTMNLSVKYKTQVADSAFQDGKYNDIKNMIINLSNDKTNNPFTNDLVFIYLLLFYISLFVFIVILKKQKKVIVPIIIGLVVLPLSVNALCKSEININTNITIKKPQLSTFRISCSPENFQYYEGMTYGDWIRSSLYKGNISGQYDSLEECQNMFGSDKGCALKNTIHQYSYYVEFSNYSLYDDICFHYDCEVINNELYKLEYSYNEYSSLEECENDYWEGACTSINNKYYVLYEEPYANERECNMQLSENNYPYQKCELLETGYKINESFYRDYDTMEECEEELAEDDTVDSSTTCEFRTINIYSPQEKQSEMEENFKVEFDNLTFAIHNNEYFRNFRYDYVIESNTFECDRGGECVSPESNILSRNNTTIKAKNIKENDKIAYYDFNTNKIEIGTVTKVYIHKDATNLIRYTLSDNTYLEVTDYHPIYTKSGWKSYTGRNGYAKPVIGDQVKTSNGYKSIIKITLFNGREDYYDFQIKGQDGKLVNNYYANGILVEGSY